MEPSKRQKMELWTSRDVIKRHTPSSSNPQLEKKWNDVIQNHKDKHTWAGLLYYVDQLSDLDSIREVFKVYLQYFPYDHKEWERWADQEKKRANGDIKFYEEVYAKAFEAVPVSELLWRVYLKTLPSHHQNDDNFVRKKFEAALEGCGRNFRSDRIWESYIEWEKSRALDRTFQLYERLLAIPMKESDTQWQNFKNFVNENDLVQLLCREEYEELLKKSSRRTDEEMRKMVLDRRFVIHEETKKGFKERLDFEDHITHINFNHKAQYVDQLDNWKNYLLWQLKRGDHHQTDQLFKRCLVPCAHYQQYWIMYAEYLEERLILHPQEKESTRDRLRQIYEEGCTVHVPYSSSLYEMWHQFEVEDGRLDKARCIQSILSSLPRLCPGSGLSSSHPIPICTGTGALWTTLEPIVRLTIPANLAADRKLADDPSVSDLETRWPLVIESPNNLGNWKHLLTSVGKRTHFFRARECFRSFLGRFPQSYTEWIRFIQYEDDKLHFPTVEERKNRPIEMLFEEAFAATPLSVNLWGHFSKKKCAELCWKNLAVIRDKYQWAVNACGLHFESGLLIWSAYIDWEKDVNRDLRRVLEIYDELLAVPTKDHDSQWTKFCELVDKSDPKEMLSWKEYQNLSTESADIAVIREKIKERRRVIHLNTQKDLVDLLEFENKIKDLKQFLPPASLSEDDIEKLRIHWKKYLQFEMDKGDYLRIDSLFQRSIIPVSCAYKEDHWMLYAKHLQERLTKDPQQRDATLARLQKVYLQACTIYVPESTDLLQMWFDLEETTEDHHMAEIILNQLEKVAPNLNHLAVRRANLYQRQGDTDKVVACYRKYMDAAKNNGPLAELTRSAENFAEEAIEKEPHNALLYDLLYDVRFQKNPLDLEGCIEALNRAISAPLKLEDRCRFATKKVQLIENFATSTADLGDAKVEAQKLCQELAEWAAQFKATSTNGSSTSDRPSGTEAVPMLPGAGQTVI